MNTSTDAVTTKKVQVSASTNHPRSVPCRAPSAPPQFKQWNRWDAAPLEKLLQERARAGRLIAYLPEKIEHARKLELSHLVKDLEDRLARAKVNHEVLTGKIDLRTGSPVKNPEKFLGRGARARLAAQEVAAGYAEVI